MAILINDLYSVSHEITGLEFLQQTKIKLYYQPYTSIWSIKWKLIKTPFSIGNPLMEYTFENGFSESQEQTEYLLLQMQGTYNIEIEETVNGVTYFYTLAIQSNALKDKVTAPFPGETTEIDQIDGFMRKIEQSFQKLSEESGNSSVIGYLDSGEPLELGETVVISETEFIGDIVPAGHIWKIERAFTSSQNNSIVGIVIEKNSFQRYEGDPAEILYRVGFKGQFNVPVSMPAPLSSLGVTGGSFYFDTTSKLIQTTFDPNLKYWGKYITEAPGENNNGYNVILIENLISLHYDDLALNTTFTLEFDRHDGSGDVKWESDVAYPNTTKWEISVPHLLNSNNLIVEIWKEPDLQSFLDWQKVEIDEIIKDDSNNMTIRLSELNPNPSPESSTSDFKGRINIINLQDIQGTSPNGLFWSLNFDESVSPNFADRYNSWYLYTDPVTSILYRRRHFLHNMNNYNLFVQIWDKTEPNAELVLVDRVIKLSSNELILQVPLNENFQGQLVISTNLSGTSRTFISLFDTPNFYGAPGQVPQMNSTGTSLVWSDGLGLWKYLPGEPEKTLTPKESDVIWALCQKFKGSIFEATSLMKSPLVETQKILFQSSTLFPPENNTLYLFNNGGSIDSINNYSLMLKGKDGNFKSLITMREAVTDLTVGPIDNIHWATTEAIKNYIDGVVSINTFIGLTDSFQETPDVYGDNNMLVVKTSGVTEGVYEEPKLKFYYSGDGTSTGSFMRIKDASLRLGNYDLDSEGDETKNWLLNFLTRNTSIPIGGATKFTDKILRYYSILSNSEGVSKFFTELKVNEAYTSSGGNTILGDMLFKIQANQLFGTPNYSTLELKSNILSSSIELKNNNNFDHYLTAQTGGVFQILKKNLTSTIKTFIEMGDDYIKTEGSRIHKSRMISITTGASPINLNDNDDVVFIYQTPGFTLNPTVVPEINLPTPMVGKKITIINGLGTTSKQTLTGYADSDYFYPSIKIKSPANNICGNFYQFKFATEGSITKIPYFHTTLDFLYNPAMTKITTLDECFVMSQSSVTFIYDISGKWRMIASSGFIGFENTFIILPS